MKMIKNHRGGSWKTLISDKQRLIFGRRQNETYANMRHYVTRYRCEKQKRRFFGIFKEYNPF